MVCQDTIVADSDVVGRQPFCAIRANLVTLYTAVNDCKGNNWQIPTIFFKSTETLLSIQSHIITFEYLTKHL